MKAYSPGQFALFRIIFGLYLAWHFAALVPIGAELFSGEGVLSDPRLNATFGLFPNPLVWWDSPAFVTGFLGVLSVLGLLLAAGWWRRTISVLLWFGWAALFNRNNLISNPSLPYVGLLLIFMALVPDGEPWRWRGRRIAPMDWGMPAMVFWGAWFLMATGYTFSGLWKLDSPSWVNGTAFFHLIDNPLARPGWVRDLALAAPSWVHAVMTWVAVAAEVLFLPLCVWRRGRLIAWLGMIGMHLGILLVVDFADLTLGMLMLHLFTFDPRWLPPRATVGRRPTLFYDGECGLCNAVVRFLLREDLTGSLRFAPLQSPPAQEFLRSHGMNTEDFDSIVFLRDVDRPEAGYYLRTDGVAGVLDEVGGVWRVFSWLRIIPRSLRDPAYKLVARTRYRLFGEYVPSPLPCREWEQRFLARAD